MSIFQSGKAMKLKKNLRQNNCLYKTIRSLLIRVEIIFQARFTVNNVNYQDNR